ncbi:MAG: Lrp/AsnC ligand binding domain-containing protein [Dehalococcoidales bacterium]|nr:Lrp/AsnC ligand binding domain-containing protein [Dehalococcoidales bacterium]
MSAKAFVLVEVSVGKTKEVADALMKLKGVKTVNAVTGPYDIIAVVEGDTLNEIGDLVTSKVHPIAGISRTVTCLTIS